MQPRPFRPTSRTPEVQAAYDLRREILRNHYGDTPPCPFCATDEREVIEEVTAIQVVRNDFPYDYFDGKHVVQHLMIVPRRHIGLLQDFQPDEEHEYWQLMTRYHKNGYSSFTRSAIDTARSVPDHLHTHLFFYGDESV